MTCEHIITNESIKKKEAINLFYDNGFKLKEIILNTEERYIKEFTEIDIDVTVVEILTKDNIEKDYFLLPNIEYMNNINELINKEITIIQYPLGGLLCYSDGPIENINEYEITHKASTQKGSSGSPIVLKDQINVIGIHKSGNKENSNNYGNPIGPLFNYFKNKMNFKIMLDNGNYVIGEIKNKKKYGEGKEFNLKGELIFEGEYLNGERNGIGTEYEDDGKLKFIGEYLNGKRCGKGKEYWKCKLKFEGQYLNGERNGKGKEYDGVDKLKYEGEYLNGERKGKGKEYKYSKYKSYLEFEGEYLNGKRCGKGKEYNNDGELKFEGEYLNGKRWNGKEKEYNDDGKLIFEGEYLNGERKGKEKNIIIKNIYPI